MSARLTRREFLQTGGALLVTFAATARESMLNVAGSISTKTVRPPSRATTPAVAKNE